MLYNVSQLLREPTGSVRQLQLDEPVSGGTEGFGAGYATGAVRILRTHHGLLVNADIEVQVEAECGRCLEAVPRETVLVLEEECYPTVDPSTGRRLSPPEETEGVVHIDTRQMLDLSEVLRQYLLTSEPLKTLCRSDCRGLCPECGGNLNTEKCKCGGAAVDPRWGALADLLSRE